jgi:hypothetical protein
LQNAFGASPRFPFPRVRRDPFGAIRSARSVRRDPFGASAVTRSAPPGVCVPIQNALSIYDCQTMLHREYLQTGETLQAGYLVSVSTAEAERAARFQKLFELQTKRAELDIQIAKLQQELY